MSKQTERTIDLVRHGRTRTKAKFQLSRKLESRRSYEGGSGSRRTRERDIYAPPEFQLGVTMPRGRGVIFFFGFVVFYNLLVWIFQLKSTRIEMDIRPLLTLVLYGLSVQN